MTPDPAHPGDDLIWATRGRDWGFRFVRTGGLDDPLPAYEHVFAGHEGDRESCHRVGEQVGVRFIDPEARTDFAGRPIHHDLVVPAVLVAHLGAADLAAVRDLVWPSISDEYATLWSGTAEH